MATRGIFEIIVLGKERVIPRLEKAIRFIEARVAASEYPLSSGRLCLALFTYIAGVRLV